MHILPINARVEVIAGLYVGKTGYVDLINKDGIWVRGSKIGIFPYYGAFTPIQLKVIEKK